MFLINPFRSQTIANNRVLTWLPCIDFHPMSFYHLPVHHFNLPCVKFVTLQNTCGWICNQRYSCYTFLEWDRKGQLNLGPNNRSNINVFQFVCTRVWQRNKGYTIKHASRNFLVLTEAVEKNKARENQAPPPLAKNVVHAPYMLHAPGVNLGETWGGGGEFHYEARYETSSNP